MQRMLALSASLLAAGVAIERDALSDLRDIQAQFSKVTSVRLEARAVITATEGERKSVGVGTYKYWAEGSRYRVEYEINNTALGLAPSCTYAFDGQQYQFLSPDIDTLSIKSGDTAVDHAGLPNPLFLLVEYLSTDDSGLRLRHVTDAAHWQTRLAPAQPISDGDRRGFSIGLYRVWPMADRMWLIGREDDQGQSSVEFRMPEDIGAWENARVVLRFHGNDGKHLLGNYTVKWVEVNRPIPDDAFRIDHDLAANVLDSDRHEYIKKAKPPTLKREK